MKRASFSNTIIVHSKLDNEDPISWPKWMDQCLLRSVKVSNGTTSKEGSNCDLMKSKTTTTTTHGGHVYYVIKLPKDAPDGSER